MNHVKNFDDFITENSRLTDIMQVKDNGGINSVMQYLLALSKMGGGVYPKLAQAKIDIIQPVSCSSVFDIFDKKTVGIIKARVRPQQKNCYADAYHAASILKDKGVMYCEGWLVYHGIPIDHAFNKIGDKYFDVTRELAGGDDVTKSEYVLLKNWTADDALDIMASDEMKTYGGVFDKEYMHANNLL